MSIIYRPEPLFFPQGLLSTVDTGRNQNANKLGDSEPTLTRLNF